MDQWLVENLACPRHKEALTFDNDQLSCPCGCKYPVIEGIPVMLLPDARQTMGLANTSLELSQIANSDGGLYLDSLGISAEEKQGVLDLAVKQDTSIDPVVSYMVGATNGIAYKSLVGKLRSYPIPDLRLPAANGSTFLDLGCNWGRWSIAAARKGYRAIGIDPSLGAVMAAKRVLRALGVNAVFIVGDARYLPLRTAVVDQVFSYSVLQHFSREDASLTAAEVGRVLKENGNSLIQMPTKFGIRCLYHQVRRGFSDGSGFEVRYWSLPSLRRLFTAAVGKTQFTVDCFFGIGLQYSDLKLMPIALKAAVIASEFLRALSNVFPPLVYVADSAYVSSRKVGTPTNGTTL
jgi:SAM-dependent methyltransferase/uncharacterized protein YbaR (Trm112 family)